MQHAPTGGVGKGGRSEKKREEGSEGKWEKKKVRGWACGRAVALEDDDGTRTGDLEGQKAWPAAAYYRPRQPLHAQLTLLKVTKLHWSGTLANCVRLPFAHCH